MKIYITIEMGKHVIFEDVQTDPQQAIYRLNKAIQTIRESGIVCSVCKEKECLGEYTHHTTGDNTKNE